MISPFHNIHSRRGAFELLGLAAAMAAVYLSLANRLTFHQDDWSYVYDALAGGPGVFHAMFAIDRPLRGYFFEFFYPVFGPSPLAWHLGAFFWRFLAAAGALWIFNILWPAERRFAFLAALLFGLYPGFSWWVSAVEYQPMVASLALQTFSIAFTLKAVQSGRPYGRTGYAIAAVSSGLVYVFLVDYAAGMEAFRALCVWILISRRAGSAPFVFKIGSFLRAWWWHLAVPAAFVIWNMFLFDGRRDATSLRAQAGVLLDNPLVTVRDLLMDFYHSLLSLGILAWVGALPASFGDMRLRYLAGGLAAAAFVVAVVLVSARFLAVPFAGAIPGDAGARTRSEALLLGSLGMACGVLPVILAGRFVNLTYYSHYGLPASLASALFALALVDRILLSPKMRQAVLASLFALTSLSNYTTAYQAAAEESALSSFWRQVSWRAPGIRPGTLLVVHYPIAELGSDGFGEVQVPNWIYYPAFTGGFPVHYSLGAATLNSEHLALLLDGAPPRKDGYRSHRAVLDYQNALVITQPSLDGCVRILGGPASLISDRDPLEVRLAAPYSRVDRVDPGALTPVLPPDVFGPDPEPGWCYYFQKADLAVQNGDLPAAAELGRQAMALGLAPQDPVEWAPFLQAFAATGDPALERVFNHMARGDASRRLACQLWVATVNTPAPEKCGN